MNITASSQTSIRDLPVVEKVMWAVLFVVGIFAFFSMATAAGGGTALNELNDWIESELDGSVGMTIALVSFFIGVIAAVAMRQFMPIIWGLGIGLVMGFLLQVVVNTMGAGLPIVQNGAGALIGM